MSIDKERTGKPSPYPMGEGCQGQTGQPSQFAHRSGGDSGDGMRGREARVTQETCLRGENASTSGTTSEKKKAVSARAGVRVPHSSLEAPESGVERRRGSCAEESKAERERGDGPKGIVTPTVPKKKRQREFGTCSGPYTGKPRAWEIVTTHGVCPLMKQTGEQPPRAGCGKSARPVR